MPPQRQLRSPDQVGQWIKDCAESLQSPCRMTLIGSGGILAHAYFRGITAPFLENSMDVDPIVDGDELAWLCYDACIGSDFEKQHGWHVNIMPHVALEAFPADWASRAFKQTMGHLELVLPSVEDLLVPKLKRGECRDMLHKQYALEQGLLKVDPNIGMQR